jgi:hypothetical protein
MRVTIVSRTGILLEFDPAITNVLAPTKRSERADAFVALCAALAVVAGLDSDLTPRQSVDVNALQPPDNVAATI